MTIYTSWSLLMHMCGCILFHISMWQNSGDAALYSIKFSILSYYFKMNVIQSYLKNKAFFFSTGKWYPKLLLYIRHCKNCMSKSLNIRIVQNCCIGNTDISVLSYSWYIDIPVCVCVISPYCINNFHLLLYE